MEPRDPNFHGLIHLVNANPNDMGGGRLIQSDTLYPVLARAQAIVPRLSRNASKGDRNSLLRTVQVESLGREFIKGGPTAPAWISRGFHRGGSPSTGRGTPFTVTI